MVLPILTCPYYNSLHSMTAYDLGSDDGFAYIDLKNVVPAGISA